jgi:hypothetical protein
MLCHLEGRLLNRQWLTSQIQSPTVYDHPHILNETVDNLKRLRCRRPSLVLGESVQPLENRIDLILSKKFICESLCVPLSQG